jgi:signal transduction histidine kinase/ActR/RegA family two-component response regulator
MKQKRLKAASRTRAVRSKQSGESGIFRSMVEDSFFGMAVLDSKNVILANAAARKLLNVRSKAAKGDQAIHKALWETAKNVLSRKDPVEIPLTRADGKPIIVEMVSRKCTELGSEAMQVVFHDVTKRSAALAELLHSESLLNMASRMTKSGGWEVLYPERKVFWSEEVRRIHEVEPGYQPTLEDAIAFYAPGKSRKMIATAVRQGARTGKPWDLELELITGKKKRVWVRATGQTEVVEGKLTRIYGTFQDITDKKRYQEERNRHLEMLEKITSQVPGAVYQYRVRGGHHSFVFVSQRIKDVYDRTPEEMMANVERGYDLIHPDDVDRVRHSALLEHTEKAQWRQEFRIIRNGELRWILDQSVPESLPDGGTLWHGFLMDITEQKQMESQLVHAKETAEEASRAKADFLAMMSHEIRTPMNGVLGFAELLSQSQLSDEGREYVQTIARCGDSLMQIIDEILDYSRLESGRLKLDKNIFSPAAMLSETRTLLMPRAAQKDLTFDIECADDIPETVMGDQGRLRQILINLAGNAVKFTNRGGVVMTLKMCEKHSSRLNLEFAVIDTGVGIPPEKIQKIFEPFSQGDPSISNRFGGSGLGLTISKRLAKLMQGSLRVESTPGEGSRFTLNLPLRIPKSTAKRAQTPVTSRLLTDSFAKEHPLTILAVDDDPVNLKLIIKILEKMGYIPMTARNGHEAVIIHRRELPCCVLMDMQMPGMDGIEATRAIRQWEGKKCERPPTFIAALTANVLPEERFRCFSAGMNDYLTKPLRSDALMESLKRAFVLATSR